MTLKDLYKNIIGGGLIQVFGTDFFMIKAISGGLTADFHCKLDSAKENYYPVLGQVANKTYSISLSGGHLLKISGWGNFSFEEFNGLFIRNTHIIRDFYDAKIVSIVINGNTYEAK